MYRRTDQRFITMEQWFGNALRTCQSVRYLTIPANSTLSIVPAPTQPAPHAPVVSEPSKPAVSIPSVCLDATDGSSPLGRLRSAMRNTSLTQMSTFFDAFIVFYTDEHLSEEPSPDERRLEYISGWSGAGTAAVLADGGAALWLSSGDVPRAIATLSCAWIIIDAEDSSQPSIAEWMADRLGRNGRIGADARLTSVGEWQVLSASLQREGLKLIHMSNLVDQLWNEESDPTRKRPEFSRIVANLHVSEYTGMSWRDKITALRSELKLIGADAMVVTALDEVAWLLNLRGKDLPYSPLLKAFVIVTTRELKVYAPAGKLSMPVREALAVFNCISSSSNCTRVMEYAHIYSDLHRSSELKILIPAGGTFQRGASAAIAQSVPEKKRVFQLSPVIYMKAQKNPAEVKGMRRAHLRDAVAMSTLLNYLDGAKKQGLSELSIAMKVDMTRATQAGYSGLAMSTRVAFAASGADPDYSPTNLTSRQLFTNSTLVIQSGGQYDEGTTVVTRTLHYGHPSKEQKRAYTTCLRALAALSSLQLPATLPAAHADPVARAPLWAAGQEYPHPTGYGVGAALNRREDPVVLDYRQDTNLHPFKEGYFITNEPAWYEPHRFGVKLGNVLEVVDKQNGFLGFAETTLVPYEAKLIETSLLTDYEIRWLNAYNERIRRTVGPELREQGLTSVYYWMMNNTLPIVSPAQSKKVCSSANILHFNIYLSFFVVLYSLVFKVY